MSGRGPDAGDRLVRVEVRLKGSLADRFPDGRTEVEVAEGATVEALVGALGLPRASYVFAVNGAAVRGHALRDGDRVQIYPPMAGG